MVFKDNNVQQSTFVLKKLDDGIPEDHMCRFIKKFVLKEFKYLDDENYKKMGRASYRPSSLLALLVFANYDGIDSCSKISEYCIYNILYKYVCDDIQPSERTLQRFIKKTRPIINELNNKVNEIVYKNGKTHYKHVAVDGTIIKAKNSNLNVLKKKDIQTLINILENNYSLDKINEKSKNLSKSSIKFLLNEKLSNEEKLNQLYFAKKELKESKQTSMGLNDPESKWMLNKKGKTELSYNLQLSVDFETKMILGYNISQKPTDHYQLENQIKTIKNNIKQKPEIISADAGYNTEENVNVAYKEDIEIIIPTGKQTRKLKGKLNENPYHKDHFTFDYENKEYICPLNVKLPLQRSQRQEPTKKGRPGKIIHQYYSNECNKCEHKAECTKSTTRVISDYGSDLKKALEQKMEDSKIQEEYKKRSQTVEPPFGVLKQYKDLNTVKVTGKNNIETRTGYKIAGYNLRRLENIMKNDNKNGDKILDLIKKITKENTYIKISIIYY